MGDMYEILTRLPQERQDQIKNKILVEFETLLLGKGHKGPLPSTIQTERARIDAAIEKLAEDEKKLQAECQHINSTYECKGSDGGWDYDPRYWYSWSCSDCHKQWSTEQRNEEIKKYPYAKEINKKY